MTPIKIVYMGTPDFAVPPLESLIANPNYKVLAVITQEDKKTGRKQTLTPSPVKEAALDAGITVLQPPTFKKNSEIKSLLKALKADFFVVVAYGQILPHDILTIPKYGCVNIHGSLLPKYRGASPVEEAILNGDTETGISFMMMDEKMDTGPIINIERIKIEENDTAQTVRKKMSIRAASLIGVILENVRENIEPPLPQKNENATYCHKISKEDGAINLKTMTAKDIKNRLRAYTPWPGIYLMLETQKLDLLEIEIDSETKAIPGSITNLNDGKIAIQTKQGRIIPIRVKLAGKNSMPIQDFLRGNRFLLSK